MAKVKSIKPQITTTVESFLAALKASVFEKKTTIPILSHVRITNNTITGTDLDMFSIVPFDGTGEGDFMLPRQHAIKILTGEKGPLTMSLKGEDQVIKMDFGGLEVEIASKPTNNFPEIPKQEKAFIKVDGKQFKDALSNVLFAISDIESRYTLNGALFVIDGGLMRMVGTDGHRLSVVTWEQDGNFKQIIPISALNWLKNNLGDTVEICIGTKGQAISPIGSDVAMFRTGGKLLMTRVVSGNYPNWEAVMPRDSRFTATMPSAKKVLGVLTRVIKCADERSGAVRWYFTKGQAILSASSTEVGRAKAELECSSNFGDEKMVFGVNGNFLVEYLKQIGDQPLIMELRDSQSAVKMRCGNFDHIIMPMRV